MSKETARESVLLKVAQRVGVQRAAGMYHADGSESLFVASACQKRPDPAAPLERRVGRLWGLAPNNHVPMVEIVQQHR